MYSPLFQIVLLFAGVSSLVTQEGRVYSNPLNGKAVDIFFVVDESISFIDGSTHKDLINVLNDVTTHLNPTGSSPYFGVVFYGATSAVNTVVTFPTATAVAVKNKLDAKTYLSTQPNPASLISALSTVELSCRSNCRANTARVTVVISNALETTALGVIRRMENDLLMTVIIAGVGYSANASLLSLLASSPQNLYAIAVDDFYHLPYLSFQLPILIGDIPRPQVLNSQLNLPNLVIGQYYSVLLDINKNTVSQDAMVSFTFNCFNCRVFASLTKPSPTIADTQPTQISHWNFPSTNYSVYYFLVPRGSRRLFVSIEATVTGTFNGQFHIFYPPTIMQNTAGQNSAQSLSSLIG